jgi:hypothetical protein
MSDKYFVKRDGDDIAIMNKDGLKVFNITTSCGTEEELESIEDGVFFCNDFALFTNESAIPIIYLVNLLTGHVKELGNLFSELEEVDYNDNMILLYGNGRHLICDYEGTFLDITDEKYKDVLSFGKYECELKGDQLILNFIVPPNLDVDVTKFTKVDDVYIIPYLSYPNKEELFPFPLLMNYKILRDKMLLKTAFLQPNFFKFLYKEELPENVKKVKLIKTFSPTETKDLTLLTYEELIDFRCTGLYTGKDFLYQFQNFLFCPFNPLFFPEQLAYNIFGDRPYVENMPSGFGLKFEIFSRDSIYEFIIKMSLENIGNNRQRFNEETSEVEIWVNVRG